MGKMKRRYYLEQANSKPKRCLVERVLVEIPGTNSLTLFREVFGNDALGDLQHSNWLKEGIVHPMIRERCEKMLNDKTLEQLRDGQYNIFDENFGHLAGAIK